jgi:hypothetical protein
MALILLTLSCLKYALKMKKNHPLGRKENLKLIMVVIITMLLN